MTIPSRISQQQSIILTWLAASGDLSHLSREPLGAKLAREVVQGARLALVEEPLQEEQQRHIPRHFVLHGLHDDGLRARAQ